MPTMSPQLRRAAAAARDLLVGAAAKEWNVAAEGLTAADGKVTDPATAVRFATRSWHVARRWRKIFPRKIP